MEVGPDGQPPGSQEGSVEVSKKALSSRGSTPLPYIKPPNKHKYNQNLVELQSVISQLETTKTTHVENLRSARENQRRLRDEREATNQRKDSVFHQLDLLNDQVKKKNDVVTKLRGGIPHSKQEDIDGQIRKLEYQISKNNFHLTEEKRIVSEIDRLRRSKKNLKEYSALKEELDKLRSRQHGLRIERDAIFQELRELKRKEDDIRYQIKDSNQNLDKTRADIDHYRAVKYDLTAKFHEEENEFRRQMRQKKEEQKRREAEELAQMQAENLKELAISEANKVPYEHEILLCKFLIQYTQSLASSKPVGGAAILSAQNRSAASHLLSLPSPIERRRSSGFSYLSDASSHYATPMGCTPVGTPLDGSPPTSFDENSPTNQGFFIKKDNNEVLFPCTKKSTKKNRSERKLLSSKKLLAHNPEIFTQFAELHLFPPTQAGDVAASIEALKEKLVFYESKSEEEIRIRRVKEQEADQITVAPAVQIHLDPVTVVVEEVQDLEEADTSEVPNQEADENSNQLLTDDSNKTNNEKVNDLDQENTLLQNKKVVIGNDDRHLSKDDELNTNNRVHLKLNLQKSTLDVNFDERSNQEPNSQPNGLKLNGSHETLNSSKETNNDDIKAQENGDISPDIIHDDTSALVDKVDAMLLEPAIENHDETSDSIIKKTGALLSVQDTVDTSSDGIEQDVPLTQQAQDIHPSIV